MAVDLGRGNSGGLPWIPDLVPLAGVPPPHTHTSSLHTERVASPVTLFLSLCQMWTHRSDPVLHIDLRRWADLMLVAPLDANTLGKVASGICDNLLVSDSLYNFLPGPYFQFAELQTAFIQGSHLEILSCWASLLRAHSCCLLLPHLCSGNGAEDLVLMDGLDLWVLSEGVHLSSAPRPSTLLPLSFIHGCLSVRFPAQPHCLPPLALPSHQDLFIYMGN